MAFYFWPSPQAQLRALLGRQGRDGRYQCPTETTFRRILAPVPTDAFSPMLPRWADACPGPSARLSDTLVAREGKALRGSTPPGPDEQKAQPFGASSLPGGRSLGVALVEADRNENTAARALLAQLGPLEGKLVLLDALHPNQATLRTIYQEPSADDLVPGHSQSRCASHGRARLPAGPLAAIGYLCRRVPDHAPLEAGGFFLLGLWRCPPAVRYRRQRRNQPRPARATPPAQSRHHP